MNELNFVHAIQRRVWKDHPGSVMLKPNDRNTQGIPDLLIFHHTGVAAIELKSVGHAARDRFAPWLSHPFTMPQVTMLRDLATQGVIALGLIEYRPEDAVYAMHPYDLSPSTSFDNVINKGQLVSAGGLFLEQMKATMARFAERRRQGEPNATV